MNHTISLMLELQSIWDEHTGNKASAAKHENSIMFWRERMVNADKEVAALNEKIKQLSLFIKGREIELDEKDVHVRKLEARRSAIKTEKELAALEHELAGSMEEKGVIEEDLINAMDRLDLTRAEYDKKKIESEQIRLQADLDIKMLEGKIAECANRAGERLNHFNERSTGLPSEVKSKFFKLIQSKSGKAIARLSDNTCGECHTGIPVYMAIEASKNDRIIQCTNCGRFVYVPEL